MKRSSPSGPADPGPGDPRRARVGRGRRWVPPQPRTGWDRPGAPAPPPPSPPRASDRAGARRPWEDRDHTRQLPSAPHGAGPDPEPEPGDPQLPRKLTVTRMIGWRARKLARDAVRLFRSATTADGAGRSGLSSLTYTTMANYASDAAIAVALANTLFFAAATAESRSNVALYLLITMAPFAVIAPIIGPLLDRVQRGRRAAMAISFGGRALLLVVMAMHLDDWLLYPAALGFMVLSKSFNVLKAAITPRVLPPEITLVKTNSRISVFGLAAGGVIGGVSAGFAGLLGSQAALWFTAAVCLVGVWLCLRMPSRVEVTEGETPASLRAEPSVELDAARRRQPMGRSVVVALWGNGTARLLTGFLTLFVAFVVKAQTEGSPWQQAALLGMLGAAGGGGSFLGNIIGARMHFSKPEQVIVAAISAGLTMAIMVALVQGIVVAVVTALVAGTGSALCKVCLDAVIQRDMPDASRASAFGRSETVLQLSWCVGGAMGVLLPPVYWIGFGALSAVFALGVAQTLLARRGSSLLPGVGGDRPLQPDVVTRRRRGGRPGPPTDRPWHGRTREMPTAPVGGEDRRQ